METKTKIKLLSLIAGLCLLLSTHPSAIYLIPGPRTGTPGQTPGSPQVIFPIYRK